MYGIFPPVFKKPMCLASAVVLCPVLLRGHPSLIPPTRCLSVPLPPSFSQWLFLLSSQLPAAFSWARSMCTQSQPGHRVPLSSKPSFWYWCLLPAVLGCDRHSPALDPWCIPQTPTHVSPLSLTRRVLISVVDPQPPWLSSRVPYSSKEIGAVRCCGGPWDVPFL